MSVFRRNLLAYIYRAKPLKMEAIDSFETCTNLHHVVLQKIISIVITLLRKPNLNFFFFSFVFLDVSMSVEINIKLDLRNDSLPVTENCF